ncbi:predicted protein [Thalassiosira pseudonana CCMP1335]|uniref:Uncharacterized protein n=1 Tax=Thalassiosira pseudonana TaxID=35128 RepID=B8BUY4_THAPS|nr:predicted protein [Thalassiosira pseudonana CCMP1335]EED95366.1 predicted protein [Thalassiosira pseudonana CCMP1335]|eukprot:g10117.t1 g10117   contig4:1254395-1255195(+)
MRKKLNGESDCYTSLAVEASLLWGCKQCSIQFPLHLISVPFLRSISEVSSSPLYLYRGIVSLQQTPSSTMKLSVSTFTTLLVVRQAAAAWTYSPTYFPTAYDDAVSSTDDNTDDNTDDGSNRWPTYSPSSGTTSAETTTDDAQVTDDAQFTDDATTNATTSMPTGAYTGHAAMTTHSPTVVGTESQGSKPPSSSFPTSSVTEAYSSFEGNVTQVDEPPQPEMGSPAGRDGPGGPSIAAASTESSGAMSLGVGSVLLGVGALAVCLN